MRKIVIIANRKHKKALKLKEQLASLLPNKYVIEKSITKNSEHATNLALDAINNNADYLIAAGGDGTLNEVINGVMQATEEQRSKVIVGLFPLGTGNDFARTVNVLDSVKDLAKFICSNKYQKIDIGKASFSDINGEIKKRYFNNIAEIGVGAKTVEIVNKSNKLLGSTLTFFLGVLRAFVGYKQQSAHLKTANFQWVGKIVAICVANGKYFGSGLGIAPDADLQDGQLSLVVVGNIKIIHFLRYLPNLRKLKKINHPEIHYHKIKACEITSNVKYPVEMDGENVGYTPLAVEVVPQALNFLSSTSR